VNDISVTQWTYIRQMICWNHGQETDFPETVVVSLNTSKNIPGNYTTTATFKISFMHHHS